MSLNTAYMIVLYHGPNCPDGFASALIARMALGSDGVLFRPVQYGQPIPDEAYKAVAVYILDFSYPKVQLDELANKVENLHVLDHHKSAQAELEGCPYAKFDMNKSGAIMTWEYFYFEREAPLFFRYIQDRDLWKWELPMSREFSASLSTVPHDFSLWDQCYWNFTYTSEFRDRFFQDGRAILNYQMSLIEKLTAHPLLVSLGGHKGIPFVNTPVLQSEVGERLCELFPEAPFSVTWCSSQDGMSEIYSLRSRGGFDVSDLAKQYGGGGHAAAAGFVVKPSGWPSMTWGKDRPPKREEGVEGEERSKTGDGP